MCNHVFLCCVPVVVDKCQHLSNLVVKLELTSYAGGDTLCPRSPRGRPSVCAPLSRRNVAVVSHAQYVLTVTAAPDSRVRAAVSKAAWWPWPLTFWPWKWCPSHVTRVTCDVAYLNANFSLPRPLCSRLRPNARDRQTSDRQTDRQTSDVRQNHRLIRHLLGAGA